MKRGMDVWRFIIGGGGVEGVPLWTGNDSRSIAEYDGLVLPPGGDPYYFTLIKASASPSLLCM